ncbi:microtubule-associated protein 70-1 [Striga asiatica]|uniref:Microtubule-associated protein 70-1 n=1 Tax=Striga asiatica TaxID=4170 RepID=A0A5A7R559_STRAF|nr:microtubule-associated protein 70-1 [Striga asiatica]
MGSYQNYSCGDAETPKLTSPGSYKAKRRPSASAMDDVITLMHGSDPVRVELSRLENEVRGKDRELGEAYAEIKALKYSERLKQKAVEELTDELKKVDEKLKVAESQLESKNLEIKKINEEKKAALAAQFAAEATLRRVHVAQKDDEMPPIEAIITPLEAELKLTRTEVAKLQEDNKALDRLTKSKEAALLDAERMVQMALAKASLVDDLQNKNQELGKQIEICQEENKILDKMHRKKVSEVEKLTQTVRELEEAVLAGGAAANAVREYQRKVQEINEEKRILDRELARAKISANRVAVVVANDWKDASDKVMPVKQWLEERKFYQGEMQQLRDKLAIADRAAKAEAQMKEKFQLRFKVLEERLKACPNGTNRAPSLGRSMSNGISRRHSQGGLENFSKPPSNVYLSRKARISGSPRSISSPNHVKNLSSSFYSDSRLNNGNGCVLTDNKLKTDDGDCVSGALYDMLQKEVISLRKACDLKDQSLKDKDDVIEMLAKKVDMLNKAMEVEAKKMRREVATVEKELAAMRNGAGLRARAEVSVQIGLGPLVSDLVRRSIAVSRSDSSAVTRSLWMEIRSRCRGVAWSSLSVAGRTVSMCLVVFVSCLVSPKLAELGDDLCRAKAWYFRLSSRSWATTCGESLVVSPKLAELGDDLCRAKVWYSRLSSRIWATTSVPIATMLSVYETIYVGARDGQGSQKRAANDVSGLGRKRHLPVTLEGKGKSVEGQSSGETMESKKGLLDFLNVLRVVVGDKDCGGEDVEFLETAKKRGLTFPRPRWWPDKGDDE